MLLVQNRITESLYNHLTLTQFWRGERQRKLEAQCKSLALATFVGKNSKHFSWVRAAELSIHLPPIFILILLFNRACIPRWFNPITITEFSVSNIKA